MTSQPRPSEIRGRKTKMIQKPVHPIVGEYDPTGWDDGWSYCGTPCPDCGNLLIGIDHGWWFCSKCLEPVDDGSTWGPLPERKIAKLMSEYSRGAAE